MERGLLWLPLLGLFIWLAWAGWNEYQKLEAYQRWAEQFEKAKYDIYAVLGHNGMEVTWGKPARQQPIALQTFSLEDVTQIQLLVNDLPVSLDSPPSKGKSALEFQFSESQNPEIVPFTDIALAAKWGKYLSGLRN